MKNFLITISFNAPYPKSLEIRNEASNFSASISRAVREWRKETKGKRVKEINIKAIQL